MNDKWMYNLDGSDIWTGLEFNTREEAIKYGREQAIKEQEEAFCNDSFRVGQIKEVPVSGVDVDDILMNVSENTTNEVGEVGEDYLYDVADEHLAELEQKLNGVLFTWMKKYGYEPDFFVMENKETIELDS